MSTEKNVSPPKISADSLSDGTTLSKSKNLSNPETLKTTFKKSLKELDSVENRSPFRQLQTKFLSKPIPFQVAVTIGVNGHLYVVGRDFEEKSCQARRKVGTRSDLSDR